MREKGDPFIWYQSLLRAMVIEKRGGAQIGVLEENMQRVQQQVDDHTGSIERLHLKVDGLEAGITEIRAMMEEVMKRLPVVKQPAMVQPEPQREAQSGQGGGAPIVGNQPSILEPIETIPRRAETRNVIPNDDPFEPRPKRLNGGVFLNPIVESLYGLGNVRPPPSFEGQYGLYGEEYWREKRFPRK